MTAARPIGILRDADDMLSLEAPAVERRYQIMGIMQCLVRASLVGDAAPNTKQIWERISNPEVGDLVVETTQTLYGNAPDRYRGFGILIAKRSEPFGLPETAWYIQYGPDPVDVCRWTNAGFYVIPTQLP